MSAEVAQQREGQRLSRDLERLRRALDEERRLNPVALAIAVPVVVALVGAFLPWLVAGEDGRTTASWSAQDLHGTTAAWLLFPLGGAVGALLVTRNRWTSIAVAGLALLEVGLCLAGSSEVRDLGDQVGAGLHLMTWSAAVTGTSALLVLLGAPLDRPLLDPLTARR